MTTIQDSFFYCLLLSLWQRLSALWEDSAARQVCLRMAQTETRYTSRKKALALAAEARQGFALLAREQEPDAAQWLAEAEQLIRELTAEPPAQPAAYDMDSLQLD